MVGCHDQLAMHQNKHCFKNMISLDVLFCFTGVVTARVLLRLVLSTRSQYPGNFHFSSFLTQVCDCLGIWEGGFCFQARRGCCDRQSWCWQIHKLGWEVCTLTCLF
jgi:hypothetical protein